MKILFCIDTMTKGGAERVIANLSNYLVQENSIEILTLLAKKTEYELDSRITLETLSISEKKKNIIEKIFYTLKNLKNYIKRVKQINPDIIISFLPRTSYYSIIAAKINKVKIIVSERNDPSIEYNDLINKILMKVLYPKANGFIFQTEDAKKFFNEKIQKRSVIIPNPINELFLSKPYNGNRDNTIVTIGRLTKQKNQKLLIDAFEIVNKIKQGYKLIIYGEGELREELENEITNKGLQDKIKLPGSINDIKEKIYKAKMFVLTSDYEGMPNALMEAMAMGLPVISTDCPCGGPKFLLENNKNGLLVKTNSSSNLANNIIKLIENEELSVRISNNAYKKALELNPKIINEKWEEYINYTFNNL